ncbi:MAG: TraB/GumN family protein [Verrucomicrobiota bacterium]|nr:TraB/GumN family protein [Verrucomicrobiota bacterium]
MPVRNGLRLLCGLLATLALAASSQAGPVWRVTSPSGKILYLAGSMHALRSIDYPLPPEFNAAFEASSRLSFEVDPQSLEHSGDDLRRAGKYKTGDSLKNHVDPRTYAYLHRVFGLLHVPEKEFAQYRPWFLSLLISSPGGMHGFSDDLGVEQFLIKRAEANKKPATGLESAREHAGVFSELNDVQAEACLLLNFIPRTSENGAGQDLMRAWRSGNADVVWHSVHDAYRDYPVLGERLLEDRNRRWIPKIESYLASGQTYMVVVGDAHMGGPQGLLALLRAQGNRVEQL